MARGKNPGVYTSWAEAEEQIKGFAKPRFKKFATREEAEEFVKQEATSKTETVGS